MKNKLFFLLAGTLLFTSCAKDLDFPDIKTDASVSIDELKVSDTFSWNTATSVNFSIEGLPGSVPVSSTLKICLPDGSVVYNRMHLMSNNLTVDLTIPSDVTTLVLTYGSIREELKVLNGKVAYSFIPVVTEE
jgi:hypothetical protein